MVMVSLFITMEIDSSLLTVPIIVAAHVHLCGTLDFSPMATICIIATAAVTGNAGLPISDPMLAITAGLKSDGQHDHIWDTSIPD
jgi:predicted histidine transporter YuiF (NhaC family)